MNQKSSPLNQLNSVSLLLTPNSDVVPAIGECPGEVAGLRKEVASEHASLEHVQAAGAHSGAEARSSNLNAIHKMSFH